MTVGERNWSVAAGDFIGYPANGEAHTMINDGSETLRCLVIGQRLAHDVSDYPRKAKRLYRNAGKWHLVDVDTIVHPK